MTPSLPPEIITEILSHLLPPLPPIPDHLIAKSLFDRITFLPPDEDDLDAWLSPAPPTTTASTPPSDLGEGETKAHILGDRLKRLYDTGYTLGPVLYAHDGEHILARLPIIPQDYHPTQGHSFTQPQTSDPNANNPLGDSYNDTEHGIDVMFIYESEDRGWVYQSSQLPTHYRDTTTNTDNLSWSSIASSLPTTPPEEDITPDEYWKSFASPKTQGYVHPGAIEGEEEEDAYWALYAQNGGQSGAATRNQSVVDFEQIKGDVESDGMPQRGFSLETSALEGRSMEVEQDADGERDDDDDDNVDAGSGSGRVMCDLPTQNGTLDPLAALLSTIPDRLDSRNRSRSNTLRQGSLNSDSVPAVSDSKSTTNRETNDLRDKVQARIQSSLRNTWMEYTKDAGESHEDLEIKAMVWLRIGRSIIESIPSTDGLGMIGGEGVEEKVVQAKMEVLWDMYGTISTIEVEQRKEVFWRLIEGCVKKLIVPGPEEQGLTQEMYWE